MTTLQELGISKTKVDRAGRCLRDWWSAPDPPLDEEVRNAVGLVWAYRSAFQRPLIRATVNLRYYVGKETATITVAQRLKRIPRVLEKLSRLPNMRLSQMQDIGGSRAVLPSATAVSNVLAGLRRNWDVITTDDYTTTPKFTGYRGVHVIIRKDGVPVEVQLRTPGQQDWADAVERVDGRHDVGLKDGDAPDILCEYFRLASDAIAAQEATGQVPDHLDAELSGRLPDVRHYLM